MQLNVISAKVVTGVAMDTVIVQTDNAPSSIPHVSSSPLQLSFYCEHGKGMEYVRDTFNIEPLES